LRKPGPPKRAGRADHHDHDHDHDRAHGHDPGGHATHHHGHGHGDDHDHADELRGSSARGLALALALTAGFLVVEAVVGLLSGSLALLSDAGHMFTDAGALGLALYAQVLGARVRTGRRTFGFRRAEILAALVNGTVLAVSAIWIIIAALGRLSAPPPVRGTGMLVVATIGLLVNLLSAWILSRAQSQNTNVRAAVAHVLADALGSVAAIVAGVLILWRGWNLADPIASILISILILAGAWRLVRDSVNILMEGVPGDLATDRVEAVIRATPGVADAHDLHVWCVADGFPILTVHVVLADGYHGTDVAMAVADRAERLLGVSHVTVQPEAPGAGLVHASKLVRR
jgi:cobalt-zinc-cadmium efflux system protein